MTGDEHYREAERLLAGIPAAQQHAREIGANGETMAAALDNIVAQAQVHAILAVAGAIPL
jgi:hypothetical protein